MRVLKRNCRTFFLRTSDDVAKDFKRYLDNVDERINDRIDVLVTPQIEDLKAVDEEIIIQLKKLADEVESVKRRGAMGPQLSRP
jgi:hypothetical protein